MAYKAVQEKGLSSSNLPVHLFDNFGTPGAFDQPTPQQQFIKGIGRVVIRIAGMVESSLVSPKDVGLKLAFIWSGSPAR